LLVVVAPQVRLTTLWTDLLTNLNSAGVWSALASNEKLPPAPSVAPPITGRCVLRGPDMHVLALAN
jgi:hypothetical protein